MRLLTAAGIALSVAMSILLLLQVLSLRASSPGYEIPVFFYTMLELFSAIIALIGVGCILKRISGVGVVFACVQVYLLTCMVQGSVSIAPAAGFIALVILYLECSQVLAFYSEVYEPLPKPELAGYEKERVELYVRSVSYGKADAEVSLDAGSNLRPLTSPYRSAAVWASVAVLFTLTVYFFAGGAETYVAVLFFFVLPSSVLTLVLQRMPLGAHAPED